MGWRDGGLALSLLCTPGMAFAGLLPDMSIGYAFGNLSPIVDGGTYDLPVGRPARVSYYSWGGGNALGSLYQGRFQENAVRRDGHFLGSSGFQAEFSEYFPARGEYFVVIHSYPSWANVAWFDAVDKWFRGGTAVYPGSFPPDSWGIIRFTVGVPTNPPSISDLGQFRKFGVETIADGATFVGNEAVVKATVADTDSVAVRLDVEMKPHGTAFDATGIVSSATSSPGEIAVTIDELIPTSQHYEPGGNMADFHWRARAVDAEGNAGAWVEYGNDTLAKDFAVKVVPLWTQIESDYPSSILTSDWAQEDYASGVDPDCSPANPAAATIGRCGCAITSAVMIARYHGIDIGIDASEITPFEMNRWLQENDGYVGLNNVNWAKVEKYLGADIDGVPHKRLALDYEHFKTRSVAVVDSTLETFTPVIAFSQTAGHYFVLDGKVAGESAETYTVRDPRWYNTETLNDAQDLLNEVRGYGNTFTHGTIFRKLETPTRIAAHVELYLASPAELLVTDSTGRRQGRDSVAGVLYDEIPGAAYFEEDRIVTSESDMDADTLHRSKVLMLPDITDGEYRVEVIGTGTGPYTLTALMTDGYGSTSRRAYADATSAGDISTYRFSVESGAATALYPTWEEVLRKIRAILAASENAAVNLSFSAQIDAIERHIRAQRVEVAQRQISAFANEVNVHERTQRISVAVASELRKLLAMLHDVI